MKKTIKLALVAAMAMGATSAFATNGDQLIGLGAKSRAMGGTGIAHFMGAETALSNPALLTKAKGNEIMFGGTYFHPSVQFDGGAGDRSSEARHNVIPEVAIASDLGNGLAIGVGMFGSAGMGTDYRNDATGTNMNMTTNLQLMKFAVPVAYGQDGWSIGFAPVLQYGALDINYIIPSPPAAAVTPVGAGVSQDYGIGYELGAAYEMDSITIGAVYKSAIEMEYQGQLSGATQPFVNFGIFPAAMSDKLEQPAEYGLGVDWTEGDLSVTVDAKRIEWGSAKGYKDFGWNDQNVYALGLEYRMDDLALRAGYNYGKNPVRESNGATQAGAALNFFNLAGFPAITEQHYTVGAGYQFSKTVSADFAFTYAGETEETYNTAGIGALGLGGNTAKVTHKQYALSAGINFNF